jgi:hypothetical protein
MEAPRMTIDLDKKFHTAFSLISYANDLCNELNYSKKERLKIAKDMFTCKTFEEVLEVFKHNFESKAIVYYRKKILV